MELERVVRSKGWSWRGLQGARSGAGEGCEEQGVELERVVRSKEWRWRGL